MNRKHIFCHNFDEMMMGLYIFSMSITIMICPFVFMRDFFTFCTSHTKVLSILVSYFIDMIPNVNGSFFFIENEKKKILKKINSIKGLWSVHFFNIKKPINVEFHM